MATLQHLHEQALAALREDDVIAAEGFVAEMRSFDLDSRTSWEIRHLKGHDEEEAHRAADEILLKVLAHHGYHETVDAFKSLRKWYA